MGSGNRSLSKVSLARAISDAVRLVAGVADVSPGRFAELATYGPGEKVPGVVVESAVDGLAIEVHLCVQYLDSLDLTELAARVRDAVHRTGETLGTGPINRVDVAFDDLRVAERVPP